MDLLARRDHSRKELARKLVKKGHEEPAVVEALQGLASERLLDDGRYAETYIQSRADKGYGPLRIRMELQERGVDDALVAEYLDERDAAWRKRAHAVRDKRFGGELPQEYKEKARQMRFLQYRGFSGEQIRAALDSEWD